MYRTMVEEVSQDKVNALRSAFLEIVESEKEDFIHPADLERVKTNDFWLKRFLIHHEIDHKLALDMLVETVKWRKSFGTNEINESNIRMDYIIEGAVFPRGRDKDGHLLFIFLCKKHAKGQKDLNELKKCIVYWLERLEREENGQALTVFFDLENCGLSNMDLDLIKYLIDLFKNYYPWFLNYIIVYEMAWLLNAVFKLIKSWLPPKAIERIKAVKKPELNQWVPPDQALRQWGGEDDYVFSFIPESTDDAINNNAVVNKKVHFADASPMSDSPGPGGDRENNVPEETTSKMLSITPSNVITFAKDGNEMVSLLELQNTDPATTISFKMKTTSPEKFRVRPSAGVLAPGCKETVSVTLLQGFQLRGLSRDKFLLMSMPVKSGEMTASALSELWKNAANKNVTQHRLRCAQPEDNSKNGSATIVGGGDADDARLKQLSSNVNAVMDAQRKLQKLLERTQLLQLIAIGVTVLAAVLLLYLVKSELQDVNAEQSCYRPAP